MSEDPSSPQSTLDPHMPRRSVNHTEGERPHPFFEGLAGWVINHTRLVLIFTISVTALAGWLAATQLKVNNSMEMFTPPDAEVIKTRDQYRDLFGRDDLFLISARGEVFSEGYLKKLRALEADISKLNLYLESVDAPTSTGDASANQTEAVTREHNTSGELEGLEGFSDLNSFDLGAELTEPVSTEGGVNQSESANSVSPSAREGSIVEETTSLVSARRTAQSEGALKVKPWFDPIPAPDELQRLKPEALKDPLLARRLVNEDGTLSVMMVRVMIMSDDDMLLVFRALREITLKHQADDFALRVTGPPAITSALNEVVLADLSTLLVLSGLAMLLALIYLFRAVLMTIGPIVVVLISVVWTMGFMALTGMTLNLLSSILPAFLLCVGLGDSIHLQSIFNTCRKEGQSSRDAIIRASGLTGPPVLFTSLSTMIGLLSFQFASVTAIKDMGLAGGVGVMFALLHSLITLPIFLKWQGEGGRGALRRDVQSRGEAARDGSPPRDHIDQALGALVRASERSRGRALVLMGGLALAIIAGVGASRLEVWHDDLETLPHTSPIRVAVLEVDRELGGVASIQILIDAEALERGIKDIRLLHGIEKLSEHILAYRSPQGEAIVGHALSVTNIIKETRKALTDDATKYALPPIIGQDHEAAQREASQLLSLFEFQSPAQLRTLSTVDLKSSHLTLQIKWQEATSYAGLLAHIDAGVKEHLGAEVERGVQIKPTGGVYLAFTIVSSLLDDLLKSFGAAFIVITLLMVLMLRGLKLGMLAMIPNLFPILLMLGALGLIGIPLDLNNLLIASIALGIAVDDTIHLLHHFQASYLAHRDRERAIADAVTHAGRAMLSTSILLSVGFSVYLFASTDAVQRFGVIIALTVLVALFVDLIICPAILRVAYPQSSHQRPISEQTS